MFDQISLRKDRLWLYSTGRFAEERRAFLCDLNDRGYSLRAIRFINICLLRVAERLNVRQETPFTEQQINEAARDWVASSTAKHSSAQTRHTRTMRFIFIAKNWLRFHGKWHDPVRNPDYQQEMRSFLDELRYERGFAEDTIRTRESMLNRFFEWLGEQGLQLNQVSLDTLTAFFAFGNTHNWKKSTIKSYAESLRSFFRYAGRRNWCMPGLAEMIQSPRLYSLAGLPEGPNWEQVRQLIANLNTEQESHIRTRAVVLLLAVYGLRIGEVCGLTLDDIDWVNEKIRVRRFKSKRVQEFPLAFEVGNAILKYIQKVRPHSNSRSLFLSLHRPFRPMTRPGASCIVSRLVKSLDGRQHYRGAHSLRHACATHLLSEGFSLKEIGDQLGHRSPRTTRIYTKVELGKLALVPDVDVSRLKEFLRSQTCTPTAAWAAERASVLREVSDFKLGGLR